MAAFRFRLARVLRLRTRLRERAQDEVAAAGARVAAIEAQIATLRRAWEEAHLAEEVAAVEGVVAADLAAVDAYRERLRGEEAFLVTAREQALAALADSRERLRRRRQEERQLERLGERAADRHAAVEAHAEAVLLDEIALRERR